MDKNIAIIFLILKLPLFFSSTLTSLRDFRGGRIAQGLFDSKPSI